MNQTYLLYNPPNAKNTDKRYQHVPKHFGVDVPIFTKLYPFIPGIYLVSENSILESKHLFLLQKSSF